MKVKWRSPREGGGGREIREMRGAYTSVTYCCIWLCRLISLIHYIHTVKCRVISPRRGEFVFLGEDCYFITIILQSSTTIPRGVRAAASERVNYPVV